MKSRHSNQEIQLADVKSVSLEILNIFSKIKKKRSFNEDLTEKLIRKSDLERFHDKLKD